MTKAVKIVSFMLFVLLFFASPCGALNINPDDYIQLKANKPAGVPLHREAQSNMFARLPDKTIVLVLLTFVEHKSVTARNCSTGYGVLCKAGLQARTTQASPMMRQHFRELQKGNNQKKKEAKNEKIIDLPGGDHKHAGNGGN